MKILFLSSCTGKKKHKPDSCLTLEDFETFNPEHLCKRSEELSDYQETARDMYTGQQHLLLLHGLDAIRASLPKAQVDLKIISAGYGLVAELDKVVPYEVTFNTMKAKQLREWSDKLELSQTIPTLFKKYDLIFVLLGKEYLKSINFPATMDIEGTCLFFAGKDSKKLIPAGDNISTLHLGNADAKVYRAGLVSLKGRVAQIIGEAVGKEGLELLKQLKDCPGDIKTVLDKYGSAKTPGKKKVVTTDIPEEYSTIIDLPKPWRESSHKKKMRYFIPEWDDLVNPEYEFLTDTSPEGTSDAYKTAVYAHQIYDRPPYDGILISKVIVEAKKSKRAILEKLGVHRYLRVPRDFPIMGDCGAFGYIMDEEPPYETKEILDYYQDLDFDYGVSIDHLVVKGILKRNRHFLVHPSGDKEIISQEEFDDYKKEKKYKVVKSLKRQMKLFEAGAPPCLYSEEYIDEVERDRRYAITLRNAKDFIEQHKKGGYTFTPIGAAQGWDPKSYAHSVSEYQKWGYKYIALGSMVRTTSKNIIAVLEEINKILKPGVDLHLFGVARPDALEEMQRLGVTSIDSASFLRRAWLGASSNYFTPEERYAAIRIPQSGASPRAKKIVREGKATLEEVQSLEERCLKLLRAYDRGESDDVDTVLEAIMTYDDLLGDNRDGHEKLIRKTLEDKPWKKCTCKICKEVGVDVIIFRGNNRNRRRGFHNTNFFYDDFCQTFGE